MQQANKYIILFTIGLTVVVGGLLSFTSEILGPAQRKSIELDTKSQILSAVLEIKKGDDVLAIYDDRIESLVVDYQGNPVKITEEGDTVVAENVSILRNYKKDPEDRLYPVFKFMDEENPDQVKAYIFPMYGNGLWNNIWGFVALKSDLETIAGASFAHQAETPGLGARIANDDIQQRFVGKEIYNEEGELVSVEMMKGEHGGGEASINYYEGEPHKVDGLSGATLTAKGLNQMLKNYFNYYEPYIEKVKNKEPVI